MICSINENWINYLKKTTYISLSIDEQNESIFQFELNIYGPRTQTYTRFLRRKRFVQNETFVDITDINSIN